MAISFDNRYMTVLYNNGCLEYFDLQDTNKNKPYLNIVFSFGIYYNWEIFVKPKPLNIAFSNESKCLCILFGLNRR